MITFFTEQDVMSFGNFLLSEQRKKIYTDQGISPENLQSVLDKVNPIDITSWYNLVYKVEQIKSITSKEESPKEESNESTSSK